MHNNKVIARHSQAYRYGIHIHHSGMQGSKELFRDLVVKCNGTGTQTDRESLGEGQARHTSTTLVVHTDMLGRHLSIPKILILIYFLIVHLCINKE